MMNPMSRRRTARSVHHLSFSPGWLLDFYSSSVGKKAVMALTGLVLLGYVLLHMLGHLKIFLPDAEVHLNAYSLYLRRIGEPNLPHTGFLWIVRLILIVAFVLHIHAAYSLTITNRRARGVKYQGGRDYQAADYAARTMRWSGLIVGIFVIFHLMDMTWGWHAVHKGFTDEQPYRNLLQSFSVDRWPVAAVFIAANIALGFHIYHGAWSLFQSLGLRNPRFDHWRRHFAQGFAAVIVAGNVSIPVVGLLGIYDRPVAPVTADAAAAGRAERPLEDHMTNLDLPVTWIDDGRGGVSYSSRQSAVVQ
jgi:succinate dehydrogenase / fumarate reductase, cytochrome b subunit